MRDDIAIAYSYADWGLIITLRLDITARNQ
jgi:hypothetical protein